MKKDNQCVYEANVGTLNQGIIKILFCEKKLNMIQKL